MSEKWFAECNCPRNMPYFDWNHAKSCPLFVALPLKKAMDEINETPTPPSPSHKERRDGES